MSGGWKSNDSVKALPAKSSIVAAAMKLGGVATTLAEAIGDLSPIGNITPTSERQADIPTSISPEPEWPPEEELEGTNNPAAPVTPHSKEAEEAVVGSVLIDPGRYSELAAVLKPADFYIRRHGWIWQAFENLTRQGDPIDFLTITGELDRMGQLEEIGGPAFLTALLNQVPTSLHAPAYARQVKDCAIRRGMLAAANEIATLAYSPSTTVEQASARALEAIQENACTSARDQWEACTLADAYQEREPLQDIVDGVIPAESLIVPFGPPGVLKSLLLANKAICAAGGIDYLPPAPWINRNNAKPIATQQCPVMWLDFDNGKRVTHERFSAIGRAHNLPADLPFFYYSMPSPWLEADRPEEMEKLIRRIKDRGIKLLVVDNLTVIKGSADINSADMAGVMSQWRRLIDATGATVEIIHHQRKTTGINARAGETISGHNSIEAALDLALLIEREENKDTITVKSTKTRGADVAPFSAIWTYAHKPGTKELETAMFYGVTAQDNRSNSALEREISAAATAQPGMNKTALSKTACEALKDDQGKMPGVNRVREIIDRMTSTGKLTMKPGQRTETFYFPPETSRLTETYEDLRNSET